MGTTDDTFVTVCAKASSIAVVREDGNAVLNEFFTVFTMFVFVITLLSSNLLVK